MFVMFFLSFLQSPSAPEGSAPLPAGGGNREAIQLQKYSKKSKYTE